MVWIIRNGCRYFEDKSEYEVNRMFRIRGNNDAMVESGMISAGDPFPNFSRQEWADYLATIVRYEEAVERYEMGLEDYEVVEEEYGPVEQHTLPSANKKLKMTHDGSKRKVENTPRAPRNQDLNLTMYKRDFGVNRVPICNPKKRKRFTDFIADNVKDLFVPNAEPVIVYGPHLPTEMPKADVVIDEEMQKSYDILDNSDNLTDEQFSDQLGASIKAYKAMRKARRAAKEAEECASNGREVADNTPVIVPELSPVTIVLSDSPSDAEVSDDSPECVEVPAEVEDEGVSTAQPDEVPSTPPQPESPGDFEWLAKITPDPDNPGEFMVRKSPSPIKTPQPVAVDPLHEPVVYMMPPKHNYPVRPNLDYVQPPSLPPDPAPDPPPPCITEIPAIDSTEKSKQSKKKGRKKKKKKSPAKDKIEAKATTSEKESTALVVVGERQSSRLVEKRVSYAEPEILEDVHFWCWRCKDDVINTCDLHGDLIPCQEVITAPGTKNPLTFPRPTFIDIRRSEIRDAGYGAFATGFIRPGVILGEYKGKMVKRKDYLKIKESGYAWEVANSEGIVSYIDGAGHRASNWLKFVNCCRGEIEQNTISRLNQGQIEYYTYKPIAIGHELKIYYGLKYYTDLGYDPNEDEDRKGEVYSCAKCKKQWTEKEYLDKHYCRRNKQFKCGQCDKGYSTEWQLTAHIKTAHLGQGHQCEQCGKQFGRAGTLRLHIASVHEGEKKFNCPFCYYSTNQKGHLARHVNTHTDIKPHQCPHCEYSCVQAGDLSSHISRQHTNKKHLCRYKGCSVKCDSEEELMSHYNTHPKRQHQCGECPMSFDDSWILSQHTARHTGVKQYQCEYCDKKFTQKQHLTTHILVHTGVKNFKCDNCGYQCSRKSDLTKHIKNGSCFKN